MLARRTGTGAASPEASSGGGASAEVTSKRPGGRSQTIERPHDGCMVTTEVRAGSEKVTDQAVTVETAQAHSKPKPATSNRRVAPERPSIHRLLSPVSS